MKLATKGVLALAIALTMAAPAAAEWYAYGTFEPNSPYDTSAWMWQDAPAAGEARVYFHVVSPTNPAKPLINPNVALLHTQIETLALERHDGYLGIWMDCNLDGYIGLAETAAREYSSALLSATSVCPPSTGVATARWPAGAHNYNGWVTEFVPIVRNSIPFDSRAYVDPAAHVWGDFDRPNEPPVQRSCTLRPFPRGTLQDTGGVINVFDCIVDVIGVETIGTWNVAMNTVGDPLQLAFPNDDDARTGTLGRLRLFGSESSEHAAVSTVDCDETPILSTATADVRTPAPTLSPAASDPDEFTLAGQYNQTNEELIQDCDTSNDGGHEFYNNFETDFNGINPANKTQSNWNFGVEAVQRGANPFIVVGAGNAGMPQDAGVGMGGTRWSPNSVAVKTGPRAIRFDLENGGLKIAPAYWLSFYAHVGTATTDRGFALPGSSTEVYGNALCGGAESGIHNGWNCDPDIWYVNPDGSYPLATTLVDLAKPGWTYELRDADCYDGRIGEVGLGIEPAYYGDQPCPTSA